MHLHTYDLSEINTATHLWLWVICTFIHLSLFTVSITDLVHWTLFHYSQWASLTLYTGPFHYSQGASFTLYTGPFHYSQWASFTLYTGPFHYSQWASFTLSTGPFHYSQSASFTLYTGPFHYSQRASFTLYTGPFHYSQSASFTLYTGPLLQVHPKNPTKVAIKRACPRTGSREHRNIKEQVSEGKKWS